MKLYKWERGFVSLLQRNTGHLKHSLVCFWRVLASSYSYYLVFFLSRSHTNPINPFRAPCFVFVCAEAIQPVSNKSVQYNDVSLNCLFTSSFSFPFMQYPQPHPAPPMPWTTTWRRQLMKTNTPTSRRPKRAWRPSTVKGCPRYWLRVRGGERKGNVWNKDTRRIEDFMFLL